MHQHYIKPHPWCIVEEDFNPKRVEASESLFSLGNGAMGQRANFEEDYSGTTFQGSYIAGVYYPDKTKVGWWKNGYPEYFAKVLNAPNWIGVHITINGTPLDLATCKRVNDFKRELNMQEGWYKRSFVATLTDDTEVEVNVLRFLSLDMEEIGALKYQLKVLNKTAQVAITPYVDGGIKNKDSNWDDAFWNITSTKVEDNTAYLNLHTNKTNFKVCAFMQATLKLDAAMLNATSTLKEPKKVGLHFETVVTPGQTLTLIKYGGYTVDRKYKANVLQQKAKEILETAAHNGFDNLLQTQKKAWSAIWQTSDIEITGDIKAQQGIRFNIFQLNQTYLGTDSTLNIGPKGFTGEKYGGSTYWDTEAYCLPFYMATKNERVAYNLLKYRYNHLPKAIENAEKLGFTNGAALYPMVTMNGEECHNEWEITFEEIHRNGAIAFAIYNYYRFTGDYSYIPEMGLEVLIGIARFWYQRANWSTAKNQYVILGVTGPNEYENNINNNWYTNYLAQWCIHYTIQEINHVKDGYPNDYERIMGITKLTDQEIDQWHKVAVNMYFPYSEKHEVFLQQDGFLDKALTNVNSLHKNERPINQHWSWDRILRSPYIKQADVLQGFYFFEDHFTQEQLEKHFDFYEPFTVHESSLSPCLHSIQAAKLGRMSQAYEFYLRTARLDLDDYNKEVDEGLHITSMAGTWLSIVEGFAGMRVLEDKLHFNPQIPEAWETYSFKINFRNRILTVSVAKNGTSFHNLGNQEMSIRVNNKRVVLQPNITTMV